MVKRTNKVQRLAYNFTIMFDYINERTLDYHMWQAAKDSGLSVINWSHFDDCAAQHYVCIPAKIMDEFYATNKWMLDVKDVDGSILYNARLARLAWKWYMDARQYRRDC